MGAGDLRLGYGFELVAKRWAGILEIAFLLAEVVEWGPSSSFEKRPWFVEVVDV